MSPLDPRPPAFSVIIPTRDRPVLLARALRSVLAQRGASYEIIVADDGGGAGAAAAGALAGDAVTAFMTGAVGQVPARNMALARARGRFIACLDDDDWWAAPDHLAALGACLAQGGGLAYASGMIVRESDEVGSFVEALSFTAYADAAALRRDNLLLVPGTAYERALHDRLGPLDETLPVYWDWDWYLRLATAGVRFADAGTTGVRVSVRIGTVSSAANQIARGRELARLCTKHGLADVVLKNHEQIAVEQQGTAAGR